MAQKTDADVNAVAVKLPVFHKSNPDMWFTSVEAQFALQKITEEDSMYFHEVKG